MRASFNFGGTLEVTPAEVVQPRSPTDVVELLDRARSEGRRVAARGAGHCQGRQGLTDGFLLETGALNGIDSHRVSEGRLRVGAGASWGDVIRGLDECGWIPPVLTDHPDVTVGGTLSVAGVGPASFAHGTQAHHCLGMEVVLGTGDVRWVTPESDHELFHAILGGLGRFGVMTAAELSVRPRATHVESTHVVCGGVDAFLSMADRLWSHPDAADVAGGLFVEGFAQPSPAGHQFILELAQEAETLPSGLDELVKYVSGAGGHTLRHWKAGEFPFRLRETFEDYRRASEEGVAYPWVEHYLAAENVPAFLERILPAFPTTPILLWPMNGRALRRPNFMLPPADRIVLVGIMCRVPVGELSGALAALREANAFGNELGGKRYLSGWLDYGEAEWRAHYGERWENLEALRRQVDPDGLFETP